MTYHLKSKNNFKFLPTIKNPLIAFIEMAIYEVDNNISFIYIDSILNLNPNIILKKITINQFKVQTYV